MRSELDYSAAPVRVERVTNRRDFDALEPAWAELVEAAAAPSVFLSWAWMRCWLDEYGTDDNWVVLTVRDDARPDDDGDGDGELAGIAPFSLSRDAGWHRLRRLTIIGQQPTYGEYLDVIARQGREAEVARAVVDHLCGPMRRRWDLLVIQRMLADSTSLPHLRAAFGDHGAPCRVEATASSPTLHLPGDFDEVLAARSSNFRGQYRNATRKLEKLGKVQLLLAPDDVTVDEAFDELVRLHHLRWEERGSLIHDDRVRFHRSLARRLAENDQLYLALLTVDGRTVAARYDFVFAGKMWCVQGGWDPEYQPARPGTVMTGAAVRWGIEHGLAEYDFLAGMHDYKQRWADDQRQLVALTVANPRTARGQLYARLRKL